MLIFSLMWYLYLFMVILGIIAVTCLGVGGLAVWVLLRKVRANEQRLADLTKTLETLSVAAAGPPNPVAPLPLQEQKNAPPTAETVLLIYSPQCPASRSFVATWNSLLEPTRNYLTVNVLNPAERPLLDVAKAIRPADTVWVVPTILILDANGVLRAVSEGNKPRDEILALFNA